MWHGADELNQPIVLCFRGRGGDTPCRLTCTTGGSAALRTAHTCTRGGRVPLLHYEGEDTIPQGGHTAPAYPEGTRRLFSQLLHCRWSPLLSPGSHPMAAGRAGAVPPPPLLLLLLALPGPGPAGECGGLRMEMGRESPGVVGGERSTAPSGARVPVPVRG